jgi:long-chain fatty acid transport protein
MRPKNIWQVWIKNDLLVALGSLRGARKYGGINKLAGDAQMMNKLADARSHGKANMIGAKALLVFAAFLVVLSTQAAWAGGFALSGIGSKAIGMGGAFRGLADDWSAAYWNPAGLTQIQKSELNGMVVGITPRPEFKPDIYYNGLDVGYRNGQTLYPNDKTNFIPDASGFFKIPTAKDIVLGLAVYVPYGLGSEWNLFNPVNMDLANAYPWYDHRAYLTVIDFHPTLAKAFMDGKLSLGVGVAMQRASITFTKTYLKPSGLPIPHENLVISSELKGTGWGFGGNAGLLFKLSSVLQFGISGRTGNTIKLSGNANQELFTFNNEYLKNALLSNVYTAADSDRIFFLFASQNHTASPSAKADLKTPADIGFGLAVKPSGKLTITGDVAYTRWSSLEEIAVNLTGTGPDRAPAENSVIMLNWKNTVRFSFGAEYWLSEPLAIRLGYYNDPSPIPDETFTPLIPDMGDKNSINIGAALRFSGAELSYNFEYLTFKDRTITALSDVNGDGIFDNYPGTYKQKLYASHISLSYEF